MTGVATVAKGSGALQTVNSERQSFIFIKITLNIVFLVALVALMSRYVTFWK